MKVRNQNAPSASSMTSKTAVNSQRLRNYASKYEDTTEEPTESSSSSSVRYQVDHDHGSRVICVTATIPEAKASATREKDYLTSTASKRTKKKRRSSNKHKLSQESSTQKPSHDINTNRNHTSERKPRSHKSTRDTESPTGRGVRSSKSLKHKNKNYSSGAKETSKKGATTEKALKPSSKIKEAIPLPTGKLKVRFGDSVRRPLPVFLAKICSDSPLAGNVDPGVAVKGFQLFENGKQAFYQANNTKDFAKLLSSKRQCPDRVLIVLSPHDEKCIRRRLAKLFPPTKFAKTEFKVSNRNPERGRSRRTTWNFRGSFDGRVLDVLSRKISVQEIVSIRGIMAQAVLETTSHGILVFNTTNEEEMRALAKYVNKCVSRNKAKTTVTKSLLRGEPFRLEHCPFCQSCIVVTSFDATPQVYCDYCDSLFHPGKTQQVESDRMGICGQCGMFSSPTPVAQPEIRDPWLFFWQRTKHEYRTRLLCRACLLPKGRNKCMLVATIPCAYHFYKQLAKVKDLPPQYGALNLANRHAQKGKTEESLVLYRQMLEQTPTSGAGLCFNMAVIRKRKGDWAGAAADCQAALSHSSNFSPAANLLLAIYMQTIQLERIRALEDPR